MDIGEFSRRFEQLKAKGFVISKRQGPTGVGHTLEQALGLIENNVAAPDIEKIELKAHRVNSNNLITLFTFNRKAWKMKPLEAIHRYGSEDRNGRKGLYYTMSLKPNSAGLFLHINEPLIQVRHIHNEVICEWNLNTLAERFNQKIPALLFVSAHSELRDGVEYFRYYRAQLMQGTRPDLLAEQFKEENIVIDLRLHDSITRARNHGTGFRVYENKMSSIFTHIEDI